MAAQFHKPPNMKYTDLCIYIDANLDKITQVGEHPDVENKIFEYLYHIIYALACKGNFFPNFEDYDLFAMYGASELYLSMRNKQINAGKIVRGKEVVPIKSCLNFIKSVLFPLKVNYQRQNFPPIINPEIGQDTTKLTNDLKESIKSQYRRDLEADLKDVISELPGHAKHIVWQTPYKTDETMLKKLYISCLLTLLSDLTIPNKLKNKSAKYKKIGDEDKLVYMYTGNAQEVILWHLPEGMEDYVRILVTKIKHALSDDLNQARAATDLSDEVVDSIMRTAYSKYDEDNTEW